MEFGKVRSAGALLIGVFGCSGVFAECTMEVADVSRSPLFYADSSCYCGGDEIKVDYKISVTCCDGYDGPLTFTEIYRRDPDTGLFPAEVSTNLNLICSCRDCPTHDITCRVQLAPNTSGSGDGCAGDSSEGSSQGTDPGGESTTGPASSQNEDSPNEMPPRLSSSPDTVLSASVTSGSEVADSTPVAREASGRTRTSSSIFLSTSITPRNSSDSARSTRYSADSGSRVASTVPVPRGAPSRLIDLGRDRSGNPSGHISVDPARFLSGASCGARGLKIVGDAATGLDIVLDGNGVVRQIMASDCFVSITTGEDDAFTLDFYTPSTIGTDYDDDGCYIVPPRVTPFVSYTVGPRTDDGTSRTLPFVERRPGAPDRRFALVMRRLADGSTFWGTSYGNGLRETGIELHADGNRRSTVFADGVRVVSTEKVYGMSGGARRLVAVERSSGGETRTRRYEYAENGNVSAEIDEDGMRTEYEYDGANRVTLVRRIDPGSGRVRETRRSYRPLNVRPHDPSGAVPLDVADDDGSVDADRPRVETELVDGVAISKTLRFVAIDTMNHRIVEEVRLADPTASDLLAQWESPTNVRSYSDYLPYDRCKPCSELPSMLVHEDGTVDSYAYSAGEYVPGPNGTAGVFTDSCCGVGDRFRTVITHYAKGGVAVPFVTTRDVKIEVRSSKKLLLREQYVCTGSGPDDYARVSWTATTRDDVGQETLVVKSDGTRIEKTYSGRLLSSVTDAEGLVTTYEYDALGRVIAETKSGGGVRPDTVTATVYDGEDRVLSRTVSSGGLSQTETSEYDGFGMRVTETAADGSVTKYLYATDATLGLETRTTIRAYGTDCAVTNTTVSYADGRTKETRLNGVVKTAYEYGPNWTKTYEGPAGLASPRWSCSYEDALGHTVCETRPGFRGALLVTSNEYNTANQLIATRAYSSSSNSELQLSSLTSTCFCYNSLGQRTLTVSDMNLNGQIDWSDFDRIVSNDTRYVSLNGDWWRETSSWQTRQNGSPALTLMGRSRTRLTGLGGVGVSPAQGIGILTAETHSLDPLGNETIACTYLDRSFHTTIRTTASPTSSLAAESIVQFGLTVSSRSLTGVTTTYAYDALGRQVSQTDGRGNTSQIVYDAHGRVANTIDPLGHETTYAYDALGRQTAVTDPLGHTITTAYDAEGRVLAQRGASYPVDYAYDAYGNKVAMTTYRNEALTDGDTTRWLYDEPSGCMTNKLYADGKGPSYTYTPDGKLSRRIWARGIATDYTYDNAGNLTRTEYDDNGVTPTISMAYDRIGNLVNATTAGVVTNRYAYDIYGHCINEWQNDFNLTRYYDTLGRSTGYAINGIRQSTLAYDTYGRISAMSVSAAEESNHRSSTSTSHFNSFHWTYLPGSNLKQSLTYPNGLTASWTYDANNQLLQVRNARTVPSSPSMTTEDLEIISKFDCTYDAAGHRVSIAKSGSAFGDLSGSVDAYTYNDRSELTNARRTKNGQPIPGFSEDFDYDPIGNRRSSSTYNEKGEAQASTYLANNLNQYTSRTSPGYAAVRGEADPNAFVTVNENPAYRFGSYFFGSDLFDNTRSGRSADLLTYAALTGNDGNDLVSSQSDQVYVPQSEETFAYDDDGNQTLVTTSTGRWRVTYNGENRPVCWVRESDNTTLTMTYDHMGRRRAKNAQRFFYDGYLQIANHHSPTQNSNYFIWDPTERVATRPLAWKRSALSTSNSTLLFYAHDGNKNVSDVVDSNDVTAHYEYAPFGAVTSQRGESAAANPWRFSCEYADDELGCVYYNYRHYEPVLGMWMTRDPVEEDGGLGLYRFYRNLPVNGFDALGMEWKIMRNGSDFADACAPTTADTFSSLAKLLRLDRKDLDKWAHTSDAEAVPGRLYKIPNLVVFHFGAEKSDDKAYLSLFSTLRRKRKDEMSAALGSGYKVLSSNNVNSHQILTAMSSDGLYKYTFVGHGYSSFINTYPDVEGLFVGPGRYTKYGITLLQLFSCNSADDDIRRRHTVGRARDTIRVWSSNVARAGLFIGYSGSPVLMSEMFSWTPIRGTNEE